MQGGSSRKCVVGGMNMIKIHENKKINKIHFKNLTNKLIPHAYQYKN